MTVVEKETVDSVDDESLELGWFSSMQKFPKQLVPLLQLVSRVQTFWLQTAISVKLLQTVVLCTGSQLLPMYSAVESTDRTAID
ncbi:hypothetical protein FB639_006054, partial [Coemansia asiatica]